MKQWWQALSPRDRATLQIAIMVISLLLFWAFLWQPTMSARSSLRTQVAQSEADLGYMQQASATLQTLSAGGSATVFERNGRSLLALADGTAREARLGHAVKRIEPISSGRVNVFLEAAEFDQLAIWLEQLQSMHGVRVDEYSLQRAAGIGTVDGRVSLVENTD